MDGKPPIYFRSQRKLHGLDQRQMGRLLGKSESFVSKLERGERKLTLEIVLIYCILFEIQPDKLIPELYDHIQQLLTHRIGQNQHLFFNKLALNQIKYQLDNANSTDAPN